jgi:thiamine-phosphate pyrophosphorylase
MKKQITGGLYLVIDPSPGLSVVLPKVEAALQGGVTILQIWNHWAAGQDRTQFIESVCALANRYEVPVLIHEAWDWLKKIPLLDGVHFDVIPEDFADIQRAVDRRFITGITCGNDEARIAWGLEHADYISFCSMFSTSATCEIVNPSVVRATRNRTSKLIFAAGGIAENNIQQVLALGVDGIAMISAIMKAEDPTEASRKYTSHLQSSSL